MRFELPWRNERSLHCPVRSFGAPRLIQGAQSPDGVTNPRSQLFQVKMWKKAENVKNTCKNAGNVGKMWKKVGKRGKRAKNVEKVGRNGGNWVKKRKMWKKVGSVGSLLRLDLAPSD